MANVQCPACGFTQAAGIFSPDACPDCRACQDEVVFLIPVPVRASRDRWPRRIAKPERLGTSAPA
jgi:hypothetical protein